MRVFDEPVGGDPPVRLPGTQDSGCGPARFSGQTTFTVTDAKTVLLLLYLERHVLGRHGEAS